MIYKFYNLGKKKYFIRNIRNSKYILTLFIFLLIAIILTKNSLLHHIEFYNLGKKCKARATFKIIIVIELKTF